MIKSDLKFLNDNYLQRKEVGRFIGVNQLRECGYIYKIPHYNVILISPSKLGIEYTLGTRIVKNICYDKE